MGSEMCIRDRLTPEQREAAEMVGRCGEALLTIINDILDLSKIEAGKLHVACIEFELAPVLRDALAMFEPVTRERGVGPHPEASPDLPPQALPLIHNRRRSRGL